MTTAYLRTRHDLLFDKLVATFTNRRANGITLTAIRQQVLDIRIVKSQLKARGYCTECTRLVGNY